MKRFLLLLPLLSLCLLSGCGGATTTQDAPQKDFLDSLYKAGTYRGMLDSLTTYENLTADEMTQFKAYMRSNADFIDGTWTYRDIHESAQGYAKVMESPIGMDVTGLTPRTDRKIVEFRFDLKFKNETAQPIRRFYAQVLTMDAEGKELDRSPRFAVEKALAPDASTKLLRLQYAYYRPTGNEMNQPKNAALRDKVDIMMDLAKKFDASNYKLNVQEIILANGQSAAEYWRQAPAKRSLEIGTDEPREIALLKWAGRNKEWMGKLRDPISNYYLETTAILTNKFEATHGRYLLMDRIDKFNGFFIGQMKISSAKINQGPQGKLMLSQKIDFWKWPMEVRIYQR